MLKFLSFIIINSVLCFSQPIPVPSGNFSPQKYICYMSSASLNIDGKLDESSWEKAEWTNDFVDIEGSVRPEPRFNTRAKMLWDHSYFYVAAELSEPDIWANLKNRDDIIFYDNDFEIFIDPDGNTHSYSEFEMNAFNTVWDLLLIQPYRDMDKASIHGWDIKGLKTGTAIYGTINKPGDTDSCWTVEVAFPWKAFEEITIGNVPPKDSDQWRVNFSRVEWKTQVADGKYKKIINPATGNPYPEDNWVWSPQGVVNMHYPEMWGYVQFSNKIVGSDKITFIKKNEEDAKWFLRQIYYGQRKYFSENQSFTPDVKKLNLELNPVQGFKMPPVIECTSSTYIASLISDDKMYKICIDNHGLITKYAVK